MIKDVGLRLLKSKKVILGIIGTVLVAGGGLAAWKLSRDDEDGMVAETTGQNAEVGEEIVEEVISG